MYHKRYICQLWLPSARLTGRPQQGVFGVSNGPSDQAGNEFGFHGVMHKVVSPERIARTFEFEGLPERGHVSLETVTFEALPSGRTRVTIHSVYQPVADRDGMVHGDIAGGVSERTSAWTICCPG